MNGMADRVARGPIRLLIADDHPVVRDGLSGMFAADPDFEVAARPVTALRHSGSPMLCGPM